MAPTVATLITSTDEGNRSAADALFATLYAELHRLARSQLARNGAGATIGTTTLLHEAYLDIADREAVFPDRARFMGYAAKVMRGLIIDYARNRQALKRGGAFEITTLVTDPGAIVPDDQELARIGAGVDELAAVDPPLAEIVDLKFFGGFSFAEIAAMHGVSERTVQRQWEKARIFLHGAMRQSMPA